MKKIFLALAALLPVMGAVSCDPVEDQNGDDSVPSICTWYLSSDVTEVITLADKRSKNVKLNVKAVETVGIAANLTFTIKADPALVDAYNTANSTDCVALESSCYSFDKTEVTVSRFGVTSTTATLTVTANALEQGKVYLLPVTIVSATGGDYQLKDAPECYVRVQASDDGGSQEVDITAGLMDDPCLPADDSKVADYTINNLEDMKNLRNNLKAGATTYVVLNADIDMSSVTDWTPLFSAFNADGTDLIEFNGKGHTISNFSCTAGSYRSFFGFLSGRVYDVNFVNATVDGTAGEGTQPCAIIAGYGGNKEGNSKCAVYDVNVTGGNVTAKAGGVGGIIGVAVNAIVKRCSFEGTITNNGRRQGGIVGYHNCQVEGTYLRVEDCFSAGKISGTQQVAGIVGQTQYDNGKNGFNTRASLIRNCCSTMEVVAQRSAGGIVGTCSYGGSNHDKELDINKDMVIGCIAWNDKIGVTSTAASNYSSGAIVGYCNIYQYFQNCYRKADLDFSCPIAETDFSITLLDQPDSTPELSLFDGTAADENCPYSYQYAYPYHGRAAAAGATCSSVARQLKWNEEVWDLSGELPKLK